jgi:hypothetical protein
MTITTRAKTITREGTRISETSLELPEGYYTLFVYQHKRRYYKLEMLNGAVISLEAVLSYYDDLK